MRETNDEPNLRINFPRNSYLCRFHGIRKLMPSTMKWHIMFADMTLGAYFRCVRETGEEDPFTRCRDSWSVQFASFERERRDVYCAKISDELQRQQRISAKLIVRISICLTPYTSFNIPYDERGQVYGVSVTHVSHFEH